MKTYFANNDVEKKWYVIDASNKILGRLASQVAKILRGKHKPIFTPHADTGDYVVITNASHIRVTGKKQQDKSYYRHSGYPGGIKEITFEKLHTKDPTRALKIAIKGMLPKTPLGRMLVNKKLKIYAGSAHPHVAQQPQHLSIDQT